MRDFLRGWLVTNCVFACGFAGAAVCLATLGRWKLERFREEHPGVTVCGNIALPYFFIGFVLGAGLGYFAFGKGQRLLARRSDRPVEA